MGASAETAGRRQLDLERSNQTAPTSKDRIKRLRSATPSRTSHGE